MNNLLVILCDVLLSQDNFRGTTVSMVQSDSALNGNFRFGIPSSFHGIWVTSGDIALFDCSLCVPVTHWACAVNQAGYGLGVIAVRLTYIS